VIQTFRIATFQRNIYIYIYIYGHDHQAWGNSKSAGLGDKFPLQKKMDRI